MRKKLLTFAAVTILYIACKPQSAHVHWRDNSCDSTNRVFSKFIPIDSANKMIGSYLNSLHDTDSSLKALTVDMCQLNRYTEQLTTQDHITNLKLIFAHTLEWINSGHANQDAGYKTGALTLIIAGYDSLGNYVYFNGNSVLEYMAPCPTSCPSGEAGQPFLKN
jgi:hypothetical protein